MATDALSYTGINRAVSDFAGAKACEELINLRPATEGTVPVKDFSVKMLDVPFRRFFVHRTTSGPHYIVIRVVNDGDDAAVQYVDGEGTVIQTLFLTEWNGDQTLGSLHFASAGNVMLISLCDRDIGAYENRAYIWKDGAYQEMVADDPGVTYSVTSETVEMAKQEVPYQTEPYDAAQLRDYLDSALNAVQEGDPALCLGPVVIATALKTKDGSTFWTGDWTVYDPVPKVDVDGQTYADDNTQGLPAFFDDFFDKYGHGYFIGIYNDGPSRDRIYVEGTKVTLTFPKLAQGSWDKDKSIVQSVEVYASRPQVYFDTASAYDGYDTQTRILVAPQKRYEDMDLGGQILYHQASIPMASLAEEDQPVELTFGGNVQATQDALDTDAGSVMRYGRVLSYNARFHFWDSVTDTEVGVPAFTRKRRTLEHEMKVLVRYSDDDQTALLYVGDAPTDDLDVKCSFVVAPSINIKEVITCHQNGTLWDVKKYRMAESSAYNFAICDAGPYYMDELTASEWAGSEMKAAIDAGETTHVWNDEPDAINVTEQYNPFVFRVEHSYLAPGNILDIQPQMAGITDASYGRDPLSVFTERGTYALVQGSADVLYGAFLPVSPTVISAKGGGAALPTDMGIFFLGDGSLWLLAGRRSTLVSDALHLGPHPYIRTCPGYKRISGCGTDPPEYDVSALVSQVSFETFVRTGGRLAFNRFRMELLISNPSYPYTYVLSLKYRQWFKIGRRIWQDDAGSDVASTPGATPGNINVVDLATEEATAQVLVHMQTRPFSMAYRHIHMHRVVAMVRARLASSAGDKLVVGLYGSDDLRNWRLLAYAKRNGGSGTLDISQIRTTPSARSWRYYTVCIGGPVPPDSDFGPVLVDYEPVIRRIG